MTFEEHIAEAVKEFEREHPGRRIVIVSCPISEEVLADCDRETVAQLAGQDAAHTMRRAVRAL